jgi:taurine dioxygenase
MQVQPTDKVLGARVTGVDLSQPLTDADFAASDRVIKLLTKHQLQPKYQYTHTWTENDILMWDHIGTLHNAVPDYLPHEHRLMMRCQVMADRIFDPAFLRASLRSFSGTDR